MNKPGDRPSDEGRPVVLHSTWTGIVMTSLGALIFVVFAIVLLASNGPNALTLVVLGLAVIAAAVVGLDMPVAAAFGSDGITRHTPLRRQHLPWADVGRVDRARSGVFRTRKQGRGGGLVAKVGRKSYALTDALESAIEFDELRRRMGADRADQLGLVESIRPAIDRTPTYTYRRKKWHPG